ncbi:MAG: CoB--CoM heterodisulfide reductase iron-sulfur subunit B family protein [Bacteroidales bacterium]
MKDKKIAIYPGCSLETSSSHYMKSLERVLQILEIDYSIIQDWNCCGATSVKSVDHQLNQLLNLRNLALAEEQGIDELVVPCAACYHRLASTEYELLNDKKLLKRLSKESGLTYEGKVKVRNVLDFFENIVGPDEIKAKVTHPLNNLIIACYYGCLNTRVPKPQVFDVMEYPMSMDRITKALGADVIDWSYKTECCGASLFLTMGDVSNKLVGKILKDASLRKADCITVACPMCQTNLDTQQSKVREEFDIKEPVPSPFITQLMGLAFGCGPEELGLDMNFVPLKALD